MKVKTIKNETLIDLPQANGVWFSYYQTLCLYLLNPEELIKLYQENKEDYNSVIDPAIVFLQDIITKLESDGLVEDVEIPTTPPLETDVPLQSEPLSETLEQPNQPLD